VGAELATGKTFGTVRVGEGGVGPVMLPLPAPSPRSMASWPRLPEKVNKDAHAAWMIKITLKDPTELNGLLSAEDYEKFVSERGRTLKTLKKSEVRLQK